MSKFCFNCGAPLDDTSQFCTKCGARQAADAPATESIPAPTPVPAPIPATAQTPDPAPAPAPMPQYEPAYTGAVPPADKPKKSKKLWLFIGIGAGAVAVLAVIFFVFILPLFGGSGSADSIVFKSKGNTYYASPYVMRMDGDNLTQVMYTNAEGSTKAFTVYGDLSIQIDDAIYYVDRISGVKDDSYSALKKAEFVSDDTVRSTPWVTIPVTKMPFTPADPDYGDSSWIRAMRNLATDGEYIYFTLLPDVEHIASWGDIAGKVGRISLDGTKIEQFSDINATDLVIDGNWIYYYDAGYNPGTKKTDKSRAGFYKIKTDGSGKELIHAVIPTDEQVSMGQFSINHCGEMKLIDGKIYFIDCSQGGSSKVARMDKDGGNFEYLTNQPARTYTVDPDHDALYFLAGQANSMGADAARSQFSIDPHLYKCDMKSKLETELRYIKMDMSDLTYHDGYLYFVNTGNFMYSDSEKAHVGLRMNVETNQMQWVSGYQKRDSGWTTDPDTGRKSHYDNTAPPTPTWVPVDDSYYKK